MNEYRAWLTDQYGPAIDVILGVVLAILFYIIGPILSHVFSITNNKRVWSRLQGKYALITDASSEVGVALCTAAAERGCKLLIIDPSEENCRRLKQSFNKITQVITYNLDPVTCTDFSFLEKYDVGLFINKVGYKWSDPTRFLDRDVQEMVANFFVAPLLISQAILPRMLRNHCGYIVTIGFGSLSLPMPYYSIVQAAMKFYKQWSLSMYYELKETLIIVEYLEGDHIDVECKKRLGGWFTMSSAEFARAVMEVFGNSYHVFPSFFCMLKSFFWGVFPKFLIGRIRTNRIFELNNNELEGLY